jgi:hypothetical protein
MAVHAGGVLDLVLLEALAEARTLAGAQARPTALPPGRTRPMVASGQYGYQPPSRPARTAGGRSRAGFVHLLRLPGGSGSGGGGPVARVRAARERGAACERRREETCPVSTEGWTRRVHFVQEGGGRGPPASGEAESVRRCEGGSGEICRGPALSVRARPCRHPPLLPPTHLPTVPTRRQGRAVGRAGGTAEGRAAGMELRAHGGGRPGFVRQQGGRVLFAQRGGGGTVESGFCAAAAAREVGWVGGWGS